MTKGMSTEGRVCFLPSTIPTLDTVDSGWAIMKVSSSLTTPKQKAWPQKSLHTGNSGTERLKNPYV